MIELVGWLLFIWLLLGIGVVGGVLLANGLAAHRHRSLDTREAKLQTEWNALFKAQRLNAAFIEARRAMWEEAIRHHRRSGTP